MRMVGCLTQTFFLTKSNKFNELYRIINDDFSIGKGQLKKEITKQILTKATIYKKQSKDKNFKPYNQSSSDNKRE